MATSSSHQRQKLSLTKSHRVAQSIIRQFTTTSRSPLKKRAGIVSAGLVAGIGIPTLVFAAQQNAPSSHNAQTGSSTSVNVQSTSSSNPEELLDLQQSSSVHSSASSGAKSETSGSVVINGESMPLPQNGTIVKEIEGSSSSQVEIDVTVDHTTSSSSDSSTEIHIDSSSSTTDDNRSRGSPRR